MRAHPQRRRACRGLSVVELLAGLAIGLIVVAAATTLLATGLHEGRRTLVEARLMQDLRSASEHIGRHLRRAAHWGAAASAVAAGGAVDNPYAAMTTTVDSVGYRFSRDTTENGVVDANEQFGFRLRSGVVEMQFGSAGWQALTDPATVTVTALRVTPTITETSLESACPRPCAAGSAACPPRHSARSLVIQITGRAPDATPVVRTLSTQVRLRNDLVVGRCDA